MHYKQQSFYYKLTFMSPLSYFNMNLSELIKIISIIQLRSYFKGMSNNDSLISENNSFLQEANSLSRLQEENNKLRNELENFRHLEQEMEKINKIRKELIIFKNIADSDNINLDDLAKSVDNAVAKMFGIKKSGLKEQSSKILSMILSIYENEAKWNLPKEKIQNKPEEKEKQHFIFAQKVKKQIKEEVKSEASFKKSQIKSQLFENDKTQKKSYDIFNKIQKEPKQKIEEKPSFQIQNSKTQKKENINQQKPKKKQQIPESLLNQLTPKEDKSFHNRDQYEQSKLPEKKQQQDVLSFPINWEQKSYFKVDSGLIRKMINDDYRKIRALNPFPKDGQHTLRFQMIKQGTVAFGIVTDQYKDGIFIDDRKVDAIKYLSFYNGGGKLSMNGLELSEGRRLHLRESEIIEITYDADRSQVRYKNKNLTKPIVIELQSEFKTRSLYFFVEMKTLSTTIKVL